jgi:hypothetical protein
MQYVQEMEEEETVKFGNTVMRRVSGRREASRNGMEKIT